MTPVLYSFFSYNYSIEVLVMVVLGGMGSLNGSIIAAVLITWINFKLQSELSGDLAAVKLLVYALILVIVVLFNNAPGLQRYREAVSLKNWLNKRARRKAETVVEDSVVWARVPSKIPMDEVLSVDLRAEEALPAQDETGKEENLNG